MSGPARGDAAVGAVGHVGGQGVGEGGQVGRQVPVQTLADLPDSLDLHPQQDHRVFKQST